MLPCRIAYTERSIGDLEKPCGSAPIITEGAAMKTSAHLTSINPEFERQVARTRPGMAHFAGTGPFAATCGECVSWNYWRQIRNASGDLVRTTKNQGCEKYFELTGKHGPALPPGTEACRHFERRKGSKS